MFSLMYLMQSCMDFANEITQLQAIGLEIEVQVYTTPKYHAELAGEGIEYSWGYAKLFYRRQPLKQKKQSILQKTC